MAYFAFGLGIGGGVYALNYAQILSVGHPTLLWPIAMHLLALAGIVGGGLVLVRPATGAAVMAFSALGLLLTMTVALALIPAGGLGLAAFLAFLVHQYPNADEAAGPPPPA